MKKIKYFIVLLALCFSYNIANVKAADLLISLSNGIDEFAITSETSVTEIEAKLGQARLVTPSAFGGSAMTFYTNDNYDNYLYIETTGDGKIATFGSFDETFKTSKYSYGDPYPSRDNSSMVGYMAYDSNDLITAGMFYNRTLFFSNGRFKDNYKETFANDETTYLKGFARQAILMFNGYRKHLGISGTIEYNEDLFYINEQFKELGTDIFGYLLAINKTGTGKTLGIDYSSSIDIAGSYFLLNPLMVAKFANTYPDEDLSEVNQAIVSYRSDTKGLRFTLIKEDLLEPTPFVELTENELALESSTRELYLQSVAKQKQVGSDIYSLAPISDVAAKLHAGKLKRDFADAMVDYVNAIRIGGGLRKVTYDDDAFDVAQHIATLTAYRINVLNLKLQHQPSKPEGVTDEFYYRAVNWVDYSASFTRAYSENIGHSNFSYTDYTKTINNFVEDSTEVGGIHLSHRQKILNPNYTIFGYGYADRTYSNEFGGAVSDNTEMAAWPNKGITLMEFLNNRVFYWSVHFYHRYNITAQTQVVVTNLNTKQTWTFLPGEDSYDHSLRVEDTGSSNYKNRVYFRDTSLYPRAGEVYQITLKNVQDSNTGQMVEYTYRSAFVNGTINNDELISSLKIAVPQALTKENDHYNAQVGSTYKLNATIDDTTKEEKYVIWSSSDPEIIKVLQNGQIEVLKESQEDVTITLYNEASGLKDTIKIRASEQYEIQVSETDIELNKGQEYQLNVTIVPQKNADITYKPLDAGIVSVSNTGLIKGLKGGKTSITIGYKMATKKVNVQVYELTLAKHQLAMGRGNSYQLKGVFITKDKVTWSSTNQNVAKVSQDGTITALANGKTTIKAMTTSGLYDECEVTVADFLKGDLTEDGQVKVEDALEGLYYSIGKRELTERKLDIGDFNADKQITVYDALEILKIFVNE